MSRAFVREDDGWNPCALRGELCMFAEKDGSCLLSQCKFELKSVDSSKE